MTRREVLFPDLDAGWQDYIHGLEAHMDEQDATIAALVEALEAVQVCPCRGSLLQHDACALVEAALKKAAKEGAR